MGVSESKSSQNDEQSVYDFNGISYDEFGNLVYEKIPSKRKDDSAKECELREIIGCEDKVVEDIDGSTAKSPQVWFIMDALWVELWLAYIYVDKDQPAPGPCNNYRLIHANFGENKWEGRVDMKVARGEKGGDYRRVNKKTWDVYKKHYPGSGPEIKITENINTDGSVDMSHLNNASNWVVEELKMPAHKSKKASTHVQRIEDPIADPMKSPLPTQRIEATTVNPDTSSFPAKRIDETKTGSMSPTMNAIRAVTKMVNSNKSVSSPVLPVISPTVQSSPSFTTPADNTIAEGGDSDDEVPRQALKIVVENRTADSDDD